MKLRYTRSGGVANISTSVEIDSEKLSLAEKKAILKMIRASKVPGHANQKVIPPPDDLQHRLEVVDRSRRYEVRKCDSQCTTEQLRLFDRLQKESIAGLRKKKR